MLPNRRRNADRRTPSWQHWLLVMVGGAVFCTSFVNFGVVQAAQMNGQTTCSVISAFLQPAFIASMAGALVSVIGATGIAVARVVNASNSRIEVPRSATVTVSTPENPPSIK